MPRSELPALSERAVAAGTAVATVLTLPHRAVACFVGDVVGFFAGSVARVPLSPATAAGFLSAESFDRAGRTFVEIGCADSLVVTEDHFRGSAPQSESR